MVSSGICSVLCKYILSYGKTWRICRVQCMSESSSINASFHYCIVYWGSNNNSSVSFSTVYLCSVLWLCASLAVMTTIRLRSCWTAAGRCSGSRWPPVGSVSSSTCGPSLLRWSAQSVLRRRTQITTWVSCYSDSLDRGRHEAPMLSQGTTTLPPFLWNTTPHYPQCLKWRVICCLLFYMLVFIFTLFKNIKLLIPWR